jgi:hypothetical protein
LIKGYSEVIDYTTLIFGKNAVPKQFPSLSGVLKNTGYARLVFDCDGVALASNKKPRTCKRANYT